MDLKIKESGNGGDLVKTNNDIEIIYGFQNMPYLAMFGGNPGYPTPITRPESEQAFDWWGNSFYNENRSAQFNSLTEHALDTNPLTSFGLSQIEQAIKEDLKFMSDFADVEIELELVSDDVLKIKITIIEPNNSQSKQYLFIWDATNKELTDEMAQGEVITPISNIFDNTFDDSFQ